MNKVREDFKRKTKEIEQNEKIKRKNEDLIFIMTERNFFKTESKRLNEYCKGYSI